MNYGREKSLFQVFYLANALPTLSSLLAFLLTLFKFCMVIISTNSVECFLLQNFALLIYQCKVYEVSFTPIYTYYIYIGVVGNIFYYVLVDKFVSVSIRIECYRNMEEKFWLCESLVFDNLMCNFFYNNIVNIRFLYAIQFFFFLLAIKIKVKASIYCLRYRHSALVTSIQHNASYLMRNRLVD